MPDLSPEPSAVSTSQGKGQTPRERGDHKENGNTKCWVLPTLLHHLPALPVRATQRGCGIFSFEISKPFGTRSWWPCWSRDGPNDPFQPQPFRDPVPHVLKRNHSATHRRTQYQSKVSLVTTNTAGKETGLNHISEGRSEQLPEKLIF